MESLYPQQQDPSVAAASTFSVRQVAVECNGRCEDVVLRDICPENFTPFAVDCQNVQERAGGNIVEPCGPAQRVLCSGAFFIFPGDRLDFFCDDSDGWDANVYCRSQ
jgi:hypothetical protein